jgi:hypothetical protein
MTTEENEANEAPPEPSAAPPEAEYAGGTSDGPGDLERDARPTKWRAGSLRRASILLLTLIAACLGGGLASWLFTTLRGQPEPPEEVLVVRPTADVVVAVRDLARLESASYHVERVIDLSAHQRRLFGLVQAEDHILLIAAADVVAGVDLSEMNDGDVTIEPDARRAVITLPPVRVLSARLDNQRTYVHRRDTDVLARRRESLETEARREAERSLQQAALDAGILQRARQNAARTVESLVRSLGFVHVEVRFGDEERTLDLGSGPR